MSRKGEFHLGRLGPGVYEGHGYRVSKHPEERLWLLHYPGSDGQPQSRADDVYSDLRSAKYDAQSHWEDNR